MSGITTNKPTNIEGYMLTASAALSLRSIIGSSPTSAAPSDLDMLKARPVLARANEYSRLDGVRFITESHIVRADADLFRDRLENGTPLTHQLSPPRPGGARSGRGRGAAIDGS